MTLDEFLQFCKSSTLRMILEDIIKQKDDPEWTTARDVLIEYMQTYLDEDEKLQVFGIGENKG